MQQLFLQKSFESIRIKPKRAEIKSSKSICSDAAVKYPTQMWWKKMKKGAVKECNFCPGKPANLHHMRHCHFLGWYPCQICRYNGQFPREIAEHVIQDHPGTDSARCKGCKEMISFGSDSGVFLQHTE